MYFHLLGPLHVGSEETALPLTGKDAALLGLLLLELNRPVSIGRLREAAWEGEPPSTVDAQLRNRIAELRELVEAADGCRIDRTGDVYSLRGDPLMLDHGHFAQRRSHARELADAGRHGDAADKYGHALRLWRGDVLAGISAEPVRRCAVAIEAERPTTAEERIAALARWARYDEAVAEAQALAAEFPYRESTAVLLMRCLYWTGRKAEALRTYESLRSTCAELGADPGPEAAAVHLDLLRDRMNAPHRTAIDRVPRQLPNRPPSFAGRVEALAAIERARATGRTPVISGIGGMGKTDLAVEWAHRRLGEFPDGQMWADLRGADLGGPASPLKILRGFLTELGVAAGDLPSELHQARAAFRSRTADRRLLCILDNVADSDQVRNLLPGGPKSFTILTGRVSLTRSVLGADIEKIRLDSLPETDAAALLGSRLGERAVGGAPDATARIAASCDGLPLALHLAADVIEEDSGTGLEDLADRLEAAPLRELDLAGEARGSVRAVFDLSYANIQGPERQLYLALAAVGVGAMPAATARGLAEALCPNPDRSLSFLVRSHRLRRMPNGEFGFHALVADYAREKAESGLTEDSRRSMEAVTKRL